MYYSVEGGPFRKVIARSSDLIKRFREQISYREGVCKLRFFRPKEWRSQGKLTMKEWSSWVTLLKVPGEPDVCPVTVLKAWLHRSRDLATKELINKTQWTNLFVDRGKQPVQKMSAVMVAKVAKDYMDQAGVPSEEPG